MLVTKAHFLVTKLLQVKQLQFLKDISLLCSAIKSSFFVLNQEYCEQAYFCGRKGILWVVIEVIVCQTESLLYSGLLFTLYNTGNSPSIIQVLISPTMKQKETQKFSYLDEFKIIKTLGSGYHAQVKLAMNPDGNLFAIKRYKKQTASLKTLQHQLNVMKVLQHENLVRLYDVRQNATYKRKDETTYKCFAIVLEYVGGGELFDFVAETGKFSEKVTRTYFHQMMNGLYFMHCKGYAHRDIKPENILLSRDFTLKLADFGFTCPLRGKDGTGILHTKLGTEGYMAPQIPGKNYRGKEADIFASGVILFIMYAGNPPFEKASPNDPYYRLIKQKNYSTFWKAHSRNRSQFYFSDAFKDLFIRMVAFQPLERPTIEQIAAHPWVRGQVCTLSQIKNEFELRKKNLDIIMDKKRQEQQAQRNAVQENTNNLTQSRGCTSVDESLLTIYEDELQLCRQLTHLKPANTDDFSVQENKAYVVAAIKYFLQHKTIKISQEDLISDTLSTLKAIQLQDNLTSFTAKFEHQVELDREIYREHVEVEIKLGESDDNKITVCFEHLSGDRLYFKRIAREIRNLFAYCA